MAPQILFTIFSLCVDVLLVLGGIAALALYFNQRSHLEYLWLGLFLGIVGASDFCSVGTFVFIPTSVEILFGDPASYLAVALQIEFTLAFAKRQSPGRGAFMKSCSSSPLSLKFPSGGSCWLMGRCSLMPKNWQTTKA